MHPRANIIAHQSGALAGTTVDLSLYPLDTLKTRLQSSRGFAASGGFRGVYAGVGSAVVGSAPGAALFFVTYEAIKGTPAHDGGNGGGGIAAGPLTHMLAASLGEIAACAVRVPTEVVKQRAQAKQAASSLAALRDILAMRQTRGIGVGGVWLELYRGWGITVLREVPFTVIQFPLWEALKAWRVRTRAGAAGAAAADVDVPVLAAATAAESALFGCASGAVAAAATTPLDVLKTRKMLATERVGLAALARQVMGREGWRAFFRGVGPRVAWISAGGAIFLGSYQWAANALVGIV